MNTIIHASLLRSRIATSLVVLLFPGFYLYNAGLAGGWFPQFFGGWYGPISLFVGLPFATYLAFDLIKHRGRLTDRVGAFVCMLIAYCAAWASVYILFEPVYGAAAAMYYYTLEFLFLWLVTYVAFKHFDYSSSKVAWLLFACWLVMLAIAVTGQQHGMYYAAGGDSTSDSLRIASYQGFARSALVTSALILVRLHGWNVLLFALGTVVLLFLLGARTEFVGVVLIVITAFVAGRSHWLTKVGILVVAAALALGLITHFWALIDQSRIINLIHLGHDTSWQKRELMESYAESTIRSHWLLGAYGAQLQHGGIGTYAHNALSAWVSFGLLGFLSFVGLNLTCFGYMLLIALRSGLRTAGLTQFALAMSAYAVVCMIFAKNVSDPIFAISWGATAAVLVVRRDRRPRLHAALASVGARRNIGAASP